MGYKTTFLGFTKSKSGTIEGAKHYFDGWSVDRTENGCILEYILARQGGGMSTVKISQEDYDLVCDGKKGWEYLNDKYII
jgi:hypothetical protein